jgi:hypothetical protein
MQMMCKTLLIIMAIRTIDISDIRGSTHFVVILMSAFFESKNSTVDACPPSAAK